MNTLSKLEQITSVYLQAKQNPSNPQNLSHYIIHYHTLTDANIQPYRAMEKLKEYYSNNNNNKK